MREKYLYIISVFFFLFVLSITCYHCFLINVMVQTLLDYHYLFYDSCEKVRYFEAKSSPFLWFFAPDFYEVFLSAKK